MSNHLEPDTRQFVIEELQREREWAKNNVAEGLGGQEMREKLERIEDELENLGKEG